jgi:GDPmannose 4,6-dehydratase
MKNKVLITGITGQDGSYLAEHLLNSGYEVYGTIRRGSTYKLGRLNFLGILDKVNMLSLEITEFSNVFNVLRELKPNYIYNLAAQSFVEESFRHPALTSDINYMGVLNFLEAIRILGLDCSFYQASTSEMYGDVMEKPQTEKTPFNPMSPYGVSKCAAHHLVKNYRVAYDMRCSSGILFNHESPLRGREFVTRKISYQMAEMKRGRDTPIQLGNLSSVRDWGYAPDFILAMEMIINAKRIDDYVVGTNEIATVRDFFRKSAEVAGFNPVFDGEGIHEKCVDQKSGKVLCEVNKSYFRPSDVIYLRGDYSAIKENLGWSPKSLWEEIAEKMTISDIDFNEQKSKHGV